MTKSEYLSRFSRAVKWRLSYQEAGEVIKDYEEIFSQSGREEAAICRELGNPSDAAKLLSNRPSYGYWLAVFCVQILSLALPFLLLLTSCPQFMFTPPLEVRPTATLTLAGAGFLITFAWFRPKKEFKDPKIPKSIFLMLGALFFIAAVTACSTVRFFQQHYQAGVSALAAFRLAAMVTAAGIFSVLAGLLAVFKSRVSDRRWRAVYILALTTLLINAYFLGFFVSADFSPENSYMLRLLTGELRSYALLGASGLLASGGSLC